MKAAFTFIERLGKKLRLASLGFLLTAPFVAGAQQDTYTSPPFVTTPPNVNATNFINSGVWNISTEPLPFQTASTYNYTNSGTMNGSIGWEFDHGPYPNGPRGWSANFFNDTLGTISALDGYAIVSRVDAFEVSYLLISATNIVNKGLLTAGPNGEIVLQGSGVNLSRSGLEITPIQGSGSENGTVNGTNFFEPDTAIYDEYWVGGTNNFTFVESPWTGTTVESASFYRVGEPCGILNGIVTIGPLNPQVADSNTNAIGPYFLVTTNQDLMTTNNILVYSNLIRQAIFVYASDTNITVASRFGPSLSPTNYFKPMIAQFATTSTNVVTATLQTSTLYVLDDLAAVGTNGALVQNVVISPSAPCTDPTYRPDSVIVSRVDNGEFGNGSSGNNGVPSGTFFYDPATFSNAVVVGRADAYSALVDNLAAEPVSGYSISNAPGKIIINANDLNLSKVRMSGGAEILIQASNLISSAGAMIDCQNLSYNFGSTNGQLNVANLANVYTHRFNGTVDEWSGLWTNYVMNVYTNYATNAVSGGAMRADVTNYTEVDLAITVVDGGGLASTIPVTVQDLFLHTTNMIVSDYLTVANSLLLEGQSLTIQGGLNLTTALQNWNSAIAPTLRYFTNNGDLTIPNGAHFGDDGATNYAVFVNNGTITSGGETINSDIFQSGGTQTASQGFLVTTTSGKVENGSIISGQDAQFYANTLKLNNSTITAGDQLFFEVTNSLFDAGGSSGNLLTCNNGFDLAIKPATGDLLGSRLETMTPMFASVDHSWSGLDLGNAAAGYTNNEAVGQLALVEGADSQFLFHATGAQNAIYVDLLDLSQCPDFLDPDVLTIDPNFVIYFAAVKLPSSFVVPPNTNGVPQEAEEYLNGQLGGHLRWVSSFAGPNSSVDVLINGQTVQVNRALRYSKIIDSNGNGIPNYYDPNPFDVPTPELFGAIVQNPPPAKKFAISWTAAPNMIYQVQYSTNFSPANWMPLLSYTNNAATSVMVTVWDTNAVSGQRFYRVSHP